MTAKLFEKSRTHQDILEECRRALVEHGQFHKATVIEGLSLADVADSINWDAIVVRLKAGVVAQTRGAAAAGVQMDLYPVAEALFKADKAAKEAMRTGQRTPGRLDANGNPYDDSFPGRYIAHGNGKKTAGYVLATHADGRFANYIAGLKANQQRGKGAALKAMGKRVTDRLIADGHTELVPDIASKAGVRLRKTVTGPKTEQ